MLRGRLDEAIAEAKRARELDPNPGLLYYWLGDAYVAKSKYEDAIVAWEQAAKLLPGSRMVVFLAYAYGMSGQLDEARTILTELMEQPKTGEVLAMDMAIANLGLGEKELAIEWLEKAIEEKMPIEFFVEHDFHFDPLRDDPRFQDLLRRMNVPK